MPPIRAISLRAPPAARTMVSRSTVMPSASGCFTETRTTRLPACSMRSALARHQTVVDADDRGAAALHAGDQALLHRGVVLDGAVTIDMIFA